MDEKYRGKKSRDTILLSRILNFLAYILPVQYIFSAFIFVNKSPQLFTK